MSTSTLNGRPQRKQLSEQIDRMDTLLDGLADALPEAVADACRDGARQAVREAITELLLNPEVRTQLTQLLVPNREPVSSPSTPAKPSLWHRLRTKLLEWKQAIQQRLRQQAAAIKARCQGPLQTLSFSARLLRSTLPIKQITVVSAGIGMAMGLVLYCCPHTVSAILAGLAAATTSLTLQLRSWFRRSLTAVGLGHTQS